MTEPVLSTGYVLPDVSPEDFGKMLGSIKKTLGKVELDFKVADLSVLQTGLQSLSNQTEELCSKFSAEEARKGEIGEASCDLVLSSTSSALPILRATDLAAKIANYDSIDAFQRTAGEVVRARKTEDPQIEKVLANLVRICHPKETVEQALVDYYAQFLPIEENLATRPIGVVRRMFEAIVDFFRKLLKTFRMGAWEVWEVLKDPDAAYLKLRGEMYELEVRHPEYEWLEYVLAVPDLFRLYVRLMFDRDVAWTVKASVLGALAYLVYPFDFLPEGLIGPIGYTDDAFLMAKAILDMTNANRVSPGKLLEHWAGSPDVLARIMWVSSQFEEHLDFFRIIQDWFRGATANASIVT